MEKTVRAAVRDCDRHLDMLRDRRTKRYHHGCGRMVRSREACETMMRGENLARPVQVGCARQRVRGRAGEFFLWNAGVGVVVGQAQDGPLPRHQKRGCCYQQDLGRNPHPPMMIGGTDDVKLHDENEIARRVRLERPHRTHAPTENHLVVRPSRPHFVDGGGIVRARRPHHKCSLPTFDLGCNI
jgi:hypothetical protein